MSRLEWEKLKELEDRDINVQEIEQEFEDAEININQKPVKIQTGLARPLLKLSDLMPRTFPSYEIKRINGNSFEHYVPENGRVSSDPMKKGGYQRKSSPRPNHISNVAKKMDEKFIQMPIFEEELRFVNRLGDKLVKAKPVFPHTVFVTVPVMSITTKTIILTTTVTDQGRTVVGGPKTKTIEYGDTLIPMLAQMLSMGDDDDDDDNHYYYE